MKEKFKLNKSHFQGGVVVLLICVIVFTIVMLLKPDRKSDKEWDKESNDKKPGVELQETDPPVTPDTGEVRAPLDLNNEQKGATDFTADINRSFYDLLDFNNTQEFEFATRGLLTAPESLEFKDADGNIIFSQDAFAFVKGREAPDTANPSLWRHTQLHHNYGLFEVMEGIYQVRGYDLTNLTLIAGDTGWIIFDPMTVNETAAAALQLANEVLGERPVVAVVYSHSHADHFGGVRGVISAEDMAERDIKIIAPQGFKRYAVSENIYAGAAMLRRTVYMYGRNLDTGDCCRLGIGLGLTLPGNGTPSYITPNLDITHTGQEVVVDGVTMVFQMTPGTEAPAEMNTWFPDKNALWMAENCNATMHNLYTLRGAQIRDGNAWAMYLMEAIALYGDNVEVVFTAHTWPRWGNAIVVEYMTNIAAMYKFINDQSLMYLNQGYTGEEIARKITLPRDLEQVWYTRPYYGTLQHNARAVYQKFMGWYDANPVNLFPLTPSEHAKKMVEYLGDPDRVLELAYRDFERGEYQWVAEITKILVYADPANLKARYLCADALEQLGYQAESGIWRAAYLTGAKELRDGFVTPVANMGGGGELIRSMEPYMVYDYMGIRIDSIPAQDVNVKINVNVLGDTSYALTFKSGVLLYTKDFSHNDADVTITLPRPAIVLLLSPEDLLANENVSIEGNIQAFTQLFAFMAEYNTVFNIIDR